VPITQTQITECAICTAIGHIRAMQPSNKQLESECLPRRHTASIKFIPTACMRRRDAADPVCDR